MGIISLLSFLGVFAERIDIILPSFFHPALANLRIPYGYQPTAVEYLLVLDGSKGRKYEYTIHPDFALGEEVISGLTTPEELARELETNGLILSLVKPC